MSILISTNKGTSTMSSFTLIEDAMKELLPSSYTWDITYTNKIRVYEKGSEGRGGFVYPDLLTAIDSIREMLQD